MCRHLAYLGPPRTLAELLIDPPAGLYEQSWAPRLQRHGTVNADGFGIGWYPPPVPGRASTADPVTDAPADAVRYRRAVPVWADGNLPGLARALHTTAALAAVRDATPGTSQDEAAAAPYGFGRWLFSHNGAVERWERLPADTGSPLDAETLLTLEARCDAALLWAMTAARLRAGTPPGAALAATVGEVSAVRPGARLNLLLTDGRTIAATRCGDTLWYRADADGTVLVASEPAGPGGSEGWREVPDHSLLIATGTAVTVAPLDGLRPPHSAHRASTRRADPDRMTPHTPRFTLDNRLPADHLAAALRADARSGLTATPKTLPPKWFYDERGSVLFEQITALEEYYPTRAEREILEARATEIASLTGAATLVELGSGSSVKTRLLLTALTAAGTLRSYAPMDVSPSALTDAGEALCRAYPELEVTATVADFGLDLAVPEAAPGPRLVAFLGSTIGNLDPAERAAFLAALRTVLRDDDALLLGADLVKDPEVLVRAYDDAEGVTAEFNKNVLAVLNRELGADFTPDSFVHEAVWDAEHERVEMWLRSPRAQTVKVPELDLSLDFAPGEGMRTEISTKFRRENLTAELGAAGLAVRRWWTDEQGRFALLLAGPA